MEKWEFSMKEKKKVRFIRKNGRVIPIRVSDKQHRETNRKIGVVGNVGLMTAVGATLSEPAIKLADKSSEKYVMSLAKESVISERKSKFSTSQLSGVHKMRKLAFDTALRQEVGKHEAIKMFGKGAKVAKLAGIATFLGSVGTILYRGNKRRKEKLGYE
jgi:hypothetical protein